MPGDLERTHKLPFSWQLVLDANNTDSPWIVLSPCGASAALGFALEQAKVSGDAPSGVRTVKVPNQVMEALDTLAEQLVAADLY